MRCIISGVACFVVFISSVAAQSLADRVPAEALVYVGWRGLADPGEVRFRAYIPAYVPCLPWAVRGIYATIGGHRYECSVRIEDDWRRTASIWFEPATPTELR